MEQQPTNWPAVIGAAAALMSIIVGAAVAYLRLFVRNEIADSSRKLHDHIDERFALKELILEKFDGLDTNMNIRFGAIEGHIEALERRT